MDKRICVWQDNTGILLEMFKTEENKYYMLHRGKKINVKDEKAFKINSIDGAWYEEALKILEV